MKKITKLTEMTHGHGLIEFDDNSRTILNRGDWEGLKVGDVYPPVVAVDTPPAEPAGDPITPDPLPSAEDLDAVVEEQEAVDATAGAAAEEGEAK